MAQAEDHRRNWLLAALKPEDLAYLELSLEIVNLPKGTILYEAGDPICFTYFPHDAVVGLISAIVSREAFGRYKMQVPGTASRIPLDRMQKAMRARSKLQRLVLGYSEALLAQTFQTVSCNAIHTVEARCGNWILSTRDWIDDDVLPLTHADLAEFLGVQRSTVSTVLRTFQTQGLITQQRGGIIIADRAGLEEIACECYGKIRQTFARLLPVPPSWAGS